MLGRRTLSEKGGQKYDAHDGNADDEVITWRHPGGPGEDRGYQSGNKNSQYYRQGEGEKNGKDHVERKGPNHMLRSVGERPAESRRARGRLKLTLSRKIASDVEELDLPP